MNATGHPTISVPMGLNSQGLPVGLQVIGARFSDEDLLRLAALLEPLVPGYVPPRAK